MVKYDTVGGLGNQLFTYCFARILAKRFSIPFRGGVHHSSKGRPTMLQEMGVQINGGIDKPEKGTPQQLSGNVVDITAIDPDRPIVLGKDGQGWFQRYEYYQGWKESIREWLGCSQWDIPKVSENALCVHVRQGDFITLGVDLPVDAYVMAAESFSSFDSVCIVSDTRETETVQALIDKYDVETVVSEMPLVCLRTIMAHRNLICSDSTFSWWGAWLGGADEIVEMKRIPRGVAEWNGGDRRVYDESRYRYLAWQA